MLALDTNVLVRYLAQDDVKQSAAATRLIEQRLSPTERGFVSVVAPLETVRVMQGRYAADVPLIAEILSDLLDTSVLELQDAAAVRTALPRYRRGGVDLHDCLIVGLAEQRGARVVTFDAKAAERLGMELLR